MLVCARCGSHMIATTREWVSKHGWTIRRRCLKCGRDKIEDTGSNSHDTSPLQTGEKIAKEAKPMVTEKALRKAGITKEQYKTNKLWKTESVTSVARRVKGGIVAAEDIPFEPRPAKEVKQPEPDPAAPLFQIFLDPELLDKLTAAAKREYRTPELHAAYLIDKALNEKADDTYQPGTYQSGSGRRGG